MGWESHLLSLCFLAVTKREVLLHQDVASPLGTAPSCPLLPEWLTAPGICHGEGRLMETLASPEAPLFVDGHLPALSPYHHPPQLVCP